MLPNALIPFIKNKCITQLNGELDNGQEAVITIPVTVPKTTFANHTLGVKAALVIYRFLLIAFCATVIGGLILAACCKWGSLTGDWLWTPGVGHVSLIAVAVKKEGENLQRIPPIDQSPSI